MTVDTQRKMPYMLVLPAPLQHQQKDGWMAEQMEGRGGMGRGESELPFFQMRNQENTSIRSKFPSAFRIPYFKSKPHTHTFQECLPYISRVSTLSNPQSRILKVVLSLCLGVRGFQFHSAEETTEAQRQELARCTACDAHRQAGIQVFRLA